MSHLKYKVITSRKQYDEYCKKLERLTCLTRSKSVKEEIDLLTLLIEKWDADHNSFLDLDPIQLLKSFMEDHQINASQLAGLLGIRKGYMSEILHYKKGLSKGVIFKLAVYFKVHQEAFNRSYQLIGNAVTIPSKLPARRQIRKNRSRLIPKN